MKKAALALLLFASALAFAEGPLFRNSDPYIQQEYENVYQNIRSIYADVDKKTPTSVKAYGAKGDGVTDDTLHIQAAVNAVGSSGTVYFPPGTYKITSAISINGDNVHIIGAGKGSVITSAATLHANSASVVFAGDYSVIRDISFKYVDLYFDVWHGGGRITSYQKIEDCYFYRSLHGIYFPGALHGVQYGEIRNCYFEDVQYPVYMEGGNYNVVDGNVSIDTLYDPGLIDGSGTADGVHINVANHVYLGAGSHNTIINNRTVGGVSGVILIPNTSISKDSFVGNVISHNHIFGARGEGISMDCRGNGSSGSIITTETSTVSGESLTVGSTVQAYQVYCHYPFNRKIKGKYFFITANTGGGSPFTAKGLGTFDSGNQDNAISAGDKVQILVAALYNVIDGNVVEREATDKNTYGTDSGIITWGLGSYTRIVNNIVKHVGTTQYSLSGIGSFMAGQSYDEVGAVHHNLWANNVIEDGDMAFLAVSYSTAPYYAFGTQVIANKIGGSLRLEYLEGATVKDNEYQYLASAHVGDLNSNQQAFFSSEYGVAHLRGSVTGTKNTPIVLKVLQPERKEFAYVVRAKITGSEYDSPAYNYAYTENFVTFRRLNGIPSHIESSVTQSTAVIQSSVNSGIINITSVTVTVVSAGSTTNNAYDATATISAQVNMSGSYTDPVQLFYDFEIIPLYEEGNAYWKY